MRISFLIISPILLVIYWRNSLRQVENLHANYDLNYAE